MAILSLRQNGEADIGFYFTVPLLSSPVNKC